jgi:hypothetical protein
MTLHIIVHEAPKQWNGMVDLELVMQAGKAVIPPSNSSDNQLRFQTEVEWKPDRAGILQPTGPSIVRQNDGRRFVYLQWWGSLAGERITFRRIKLYTQQIDGFTPDASHVEANVMGIDAKGCPACSTAIIKEK